MATETDIPDSIYSKQKCEMQDNELASEPLDEKVTEPASNRLKQLESSPNQPLESSSNVGETGIKQVEAQIAAGRESDISKDAAGTIEDESFFQSPSAEETSSTQEAYLATTTLDQAERRMPEIEPLKEGKSGDDERVEVAASKETSADEHPPSSGDNIKEVKNEVEREVITSEKVVEATFAQTEGSLVHSIGLQEVTDMDSEEVKNTDFWNSTQTESQAKKNEGKKDEEEAIETTDSGKEKTGSSSVNAACEKTGSVRAGSEEDGELPDNSSIRLNEETIPISSEDEVQKKDQELDLLAEKDQGSADAASEDIKERATSHVKTATNAQGSFGDPIEILNAETEEKAITEKENPVEASEEYEKNGIVEHKGELKQEESANAAVFCSSEFEQEIEANSKQDEADAVNKQEEKCEMQDNELASESSDEKVTEPPSNRLKQLESRPNQSLESSSNVGETGIKQVEAQTEAGRENDITKDAAGTIEGESFFQSLSAEETSSTQEAYEATTTLDQVERRMPEIEPLKERKSGDDERVEVAASKENSADEHPPSSGDNVKEVKNEVEREVITSEKVVEATFAQTEGSLVHSIGLQKVIDMDSEEVKDTDFWNSTQTESQAKENEGKKDEEEAIETTESGKEKTGSSSVNAACEKTGSVKAEAEEDGELPDNSIIKLNKETIPISSEDGVQKKDQELDLLAEKDQGSADAESEDIKERATSHAQTAANVQEPFGGPIEILNAETEGKAIDEKGSPVKASEDYKKHGIIEHKGELKQAESANAVVFCSSEIEQEVEANSEQDEADAVNKKEEVKSSETELTVQDFDAAYHVEDAETEHLKDEMKKDSDTQDVIGSSEGTELVGSEEFTACTSKPKVPQNVTEDGIFEKSEPSVTRNLEETSLKEIKEDDKMESINSDLSSEKTGLTHVGAYETGAIDVNSTAKLEDCNVDENKNNQIPETAKFEANIAGEETDHAASGGTEKAPLGNKDEATGEIPQSHRPDEILSESSSQLLESHIPVTTEMNEATEGNLQGVEISYNKEGSPIATETEYEKLQKIGVQSIDPETRMQMGNVAEEFDKKEDLCLTPEQKEKSIEASSASIKTNEEIDCSETSELKMQELEKGLKADASYSKYEEAETGIYFATAREGLELISSSEQQESSITSIEKDKSNTMFSGTKISMNKDGSNTVKNMNLEAVGVKTSLEPEKSTEQDFQGSESQANKEMEVKLEAEHQVNKIEDRSEMIEEMSEELRQPKEQKFEEDICAKELQMQTSSNDALKKSETEYDKVVIESLDGKVVELPCNAVKQLESSPNQPLETSCSVEGTGVGQVDTDTDIGRDNAVTEADIGTIDGETFIQSPSVSEVTTDESSSIQEGTKGTTTQNDAERKTTEIKPLKEGKPKDDDHIEVLESQNTSADEHSPTTRDKMKEPQNEAEGDVVEYENSMEGEVVESENSRETTFAQIEASSVQSFGLTKGADVNTEEVNETCNKEESMGDSPNTKTSSSGEVLQGRDYHSEGKEPEFSQALEGIESNTEEKECIDEIEEKVDQQVFPHASNADICISTQIESQNEGTENEENKNGKSIENDDGGNEKSGEPSVNAVCEKADSEEAGTEEDRKLSDSSTVKLNEEALLISNEDEVQEKEQELNLLPEKEQGEEGIKESQDAASKDIKETTTSQHATTVAYIEGQRLIGSPEEIHKGEIVDKAINVQDIIDDKGPVKDEASEDIKEAATSQHATTIANFNEQRITGNSKEILEGEIEDKAIDVQDIVEKSPVKDAACDDIKEAAISQHATTVTYIEEQKLIANPEEIVKGEVENKAINAQDIDEKPVKASEEYKNDENRGEQKPVESVNEPVFVSSEMEDEVLGNSKEDETDAVKKTEEASEEYETDENKEEQNPGESVNEPVHVSSEIEQEVLGNSKEDETDAVKKTEEVENSEAKFIDQDFDIKCPVEDTENENTPEELKPKDYETQDDKGLSEGTLSKESEDLVSSSKPKVPQDVAEDEILGKPEPTFIGIPEETNPKEDDKVQSINSDLSSEKTGIEHGACETEFVDASTIVKEDPKSNDNKPGDERKCEALAGNQKILPENKDEATGEIPQTHISEQIIKESSAPLSGLHIPETTEVNEAKEESLQDFEMLYDKAGSPIATEAEYVKLQKIDRSMDEETRMQMGIMTEEVNKEEHLSSYPEQEKSIDASSGNFRSNEETGSSDTGELQMREVGKGLEVEASSDQAAKEKPTALLQTTADELQGDISTISSGESLPVCQILMDLGNGMHSSSIEPSTEDTSNIGKSKAESEKLPLESVFDEVVPKSEDSKVKEEHLTSATAECTNEDNLDEENQTTANDISNEEKTEETTDIEQAAEHPSTVYDNAVLVAEELGRSSGKENITGEDRSINIPYQDPVADETIDERCPLETEEGNVKHAPTDSDETKLDDTKVEAKDMTEENLEPCEELRPASESMSEYQLNETPLQQEISDVDNEKNKIEGQALESHFEHISEKDSAEVKRDIDENVTLENQNKSTQDHSETMKDVILTEEIEQVPVEIEKEKIADEDICTTEPQKISASNQKEIANEGSYLDPTPSENSEVTEVRADARIKDLQAAGNLYEEAKASSTITGSRTGMIEDTEKHAGIVEDIKDDSENEKPKEERIPSVEEALTLEPQEKFPNNESTDSPADNQDSMKLRQPVIQSIQEPTEEGVVDSSNANNKTECLLITHSAERECVPEEVLEKRKEASGLEFHTDEKNAITSESQIPEEIQKTEMTEEHLDAKETIEIIAEPENKEAHEDSIRVREPSEELEGVDTKEDMEVKGSGERKATEKSYQDGVGEVTVTKSPKHEKEEQEAPIEVQTHEKEDVTATGKSYQDGVADVTVTESPKHEKVEQEALIEVQTHEKEDAMNFRKTNRETMAISKENPMSIEPHEETKPTMADDQTSEPSSGANKIEIDNSSISNKDQNLEFTEEEKNFSEVQREIDEEAQRKIPAYNKETQYAHEMVKDVIMTEEVALEVEKAEESRVIKDTINEEGWVKDQLSSATDERVCQITTDASPHEILQSAGYEATEDLELAADNQDLKAETFTNVSDKDMKQNIEKTANIITSELECSEKMVTEENTERAEAREEKEILEKPHADEIGTGKSGTSDSVSESKEHNIQEVGGGERKDHGSMEEPEEKIIEVSKTESEGAQVITGGEEVGASSTEKNQGASCEMLAEKKNPAIITSSEQTEDESKTKDETLVSMSMEETSARGAEELTWLSKEKTEELQVLTARSEIDEGKKNESPDKMLKKESEAAQTQEHVSERKSVDSPSEEGIREQGTITHGGSQEPLEEKSLLSQKFEDSLIQLSADKETLQSEVGINYEETHIKEINEHDEVLDSTNQGQGQSPDAVRNAEFSETEQQHLNKKEATLESMNRKNQNEQIKEADENIGGEVSNEEEPKPTTVHMEATKKSDTFVMSADEEENRNKLSEDESKKQDSQEYPEEQTCQELEVAKHPFHTEELSRKIEKAVPIEDIQQEKMAKGNILEEETKERTNLVNTPVKVDHEKEGDETNCEGTSTETLTPMAEFNKSEVESIHNDMDARAVDNYALTKNHEVQSANLKVPSVVDAIVEEAGHEKDSNNGTAEVYEAELVKEDVHRESTGGISKTSEEVGAKEQVNSPPIDYSNIEAKIDEGIEHENPQNSISDKQKEEEAKITRKEECIENEEELRADEPLNLPERSVGYDASVSHGAEDTEDLKISQKYGMVGLMEVGEISKEIQKQISEEPHQNESMKSGSIDVIQGQGEPTAKSLDAEAGSLKAAKASNAEPQHSSVVFEEAEKLGDECKDRKEKSETIESAKISLADILQESTKGNSQAASNLVEERTVTLKNEHKQVVTEETGDCEGNIDDEKEEEEDNDDDPKVDSCSDAAVLVDASKDMEVKVHKKSHNILSGVGSRVKHSIAKVKKAITGKSSHPKPPSPKQRDEVIN